MVRLNLLEHIFAAFIYLCHLWPVVPNIFDGEIMPFYHVQYNFNTAVREHLTVLGVLEMLSPLTP